MKNDYVLYESRTKTFHAYFKTNKKDKMAGLQKALTNNNIYRILKQNVKRTHLRNIPAAQRYAK